MTDYDNTNRGALFKNDRKETENHPDYTGKIDVEGTERYISAWLKKSKGGKTFMSLSLGKPVQDTGNREQPKGVNDKTQSGSDKGGFDAFEDSVPF